MKKAITSIICLVLLTGNACQSGQQNEGGAHVADAGYVQIVLFHLARRCESCNAVERETKAVLEEEYGEAVLSGKLSFVSLNFQDEKGKKAAKHLRASGQSLFVTKGDSITDLSSAAFMFASTHPARYREALRKALDQYLE